MERAAARSRRGAELPPGGHGGPTGSGAADIALSEMRALKEGVATYYITVHHILPYISCNDSEFRASKEDVPPYRERTGNGGVSGVGGTLVITMAAALHNNL
jgi:hypothetical protein